VAKGRKRKDVEALVLALACGASPENAAKNAGVSVRTVHRRLADSAFSMRVNEMRSAMQRRAADMFSAAGPSAIKTLMSLHESAKSESVRLGAARTIIELGCKLRESVDWTQRVEALESELATLLTSKQACGAAAGSEAT
jgi:hypothetical protein